MLFKFNFFWKFLLSILCGWIFYGFFGYEFSVITLLSILVSLMWAGHRSDFKTLGE